MSKLVVGALALSAVGYLAYRAMYSYHDNAKADMAQDMAERSASAPKQQLDNVRAKARDIEAKDQQYTDKVQEETQSP